MNNKVKYGLLAGISMSSWLYIEYVLGLHETTYGAYTGFLIWLFFMFFLFMAIRQERKNRGGYLTTGEGFRTGLGASLVAGLIFAFAIFAYFKWVNPGWVESYIPQIKQQMAEQDKLPEEIAKAVENFRNSYQPQRQALQTLMGILAFGTLFSMIISLVLKKKPEDASSPE